MVAGGQVDIGVYEDLTDPFHTEHDLVALRTLLLGVPEDGLHGDPLFRLSLEETNVTSNPDAPFGVERCSHRTATAALFLLFARMFPEVSTFWCV